MADNTNTIDSIDQERMEALATEKLREYLLNVQTNLEILSNYLQQEHRKVSPCQRIEIDHKLCEQLGVFPGSEAGYIASFIKASLPLHAEKLNKDQGNAAWSCEALYQQIVNSKDAETVEAIRRIVKSPGSYSESDTFYLNAICDLQIINLSK